MEFNINDLVNCQNEETLYIIRDINNNLATITGYSYRIKKIVEVDKLSIATDEQINNEKKDIQKKKERLLNKKNTRSSNKVLYGRILHIDGDKEFLESCMELYKEMNIPYDGIYLSEEYVKDKIENILLESTPDIIVITGHDVYNGKGKKDIKNYQNSKNFIDAVRIIRKHFDANSVVVIVGACGSHFEALIASGANFSSSPKRINIHTYDPAIIAIKVSTTSCNQTVDFNQILEFIENRRDAFGGIETKGKMKLLL